MHIGLGPWIDDAAGTGVLGAASLYAYPAIRMGENVLVRRRTAAL